MPQTCIFCDSNDVTLEHIFAKWLRDLFPDDGVMTCELIRRNGTVVSYPLGHFQQTVKVVCEKCNGGWMNELETQAAPILGPMMHHNAVTNLTPIMQAVLARWATMKALVFEHLHPKERLIPKSEYEAFYATRQPSQGWTIVAANRRSLASGLGREQLVGYREQAATIQIDAAMEQQFRRWHEEGRRAYRVTFMIGRVVFHVFGNNIPHTFDTMAVTEDLARRIWPVQGDVTWPPRVSIETVGGMDAFHNAFNAMPQPPQTAQ